MPPRLLIAHLHAVYFHCISRNFKADDWGLDCSIYTILVAICRPARLHGAARCSISCRVIGTAVPCQGRSSDPRTYRRRFAWCRLRGVLSRESVVRLRRLWSKSSNEVVVGSLGINTNSKRACLALEAGSSEAEVAVHHFSATSPHPSP